MKETETRQQQKEVQDLLKTISEQKIQTRATAQRTRQIIEAYGKGKKALKLRRPLEEPILLFKRGNTFEIYEAVRGGRFDFKHSGDGSERFIIIDKATQYTLSTGRDQVKMYLGDEDTPVTGWPNPILMTEQVCAFVDTTLHNFREWMLKQEKMKMQYWLYIGGAIALIIVAIGLMKAISPQTATVIIQGAGNITSTGTAIVQNTTGAVLNGSQIL